VPTPVAPDPVDFDAECKREFDLYEPERQELRKAELDAEKNYDTMMVTLSSLAIGVSLTVVKDFIGKDKARWLLSIGLALLAFVACLILAFWDKKLTFRTHRAWREKLDDKFKNWKPGAWDEAQSEYHLIAGINCIDKIKNAAEVCLISGIVLLTVFVLANLFPRNNAHAESNPNTANTTVAEPATRRASANSATSTPPTTPQAIKVNIGSAAIPTPSASTTNRSSIAGGAGAASQWGATTSPATKP
jgi:hypothetical protein